MSHKTYTKYNTKKTPQSQPIPGKDMVQNNAGGYTFQISELQQLQRFCTLGSENGTYYASEKDHTLQNCKAISELIKKGKGKEAVDLIVSISDEGRAPKNDPALFALAMIAGIGSTEERQYALAALPKVARIGTHLFHFAKYVQQFRGWGHGLRKAIAEWYTSKEASNLAFQLVKYQSRDGWSNKDLIKLSHAQASNSASNLALRWATRGFTPFENKKFPEKSEKWSQSELEKTYQEQVEFIWAYEQMKRATSENEVISLVQKYRMPLEAVPTEKQTKKVLEAALPNLGLTAIIRNLGRYTSDGVISPLSDTSKFVIERLSDMEQLKKARVHPIQILSALMVYKAGHGFKGSLSWKPISAVLDALDEAFYLSFGIVQPTGKNILIGLDISGSMGGNMINGLPFLDARMGSAAMAMVTARTEKNHLIVGFTSGGWKSKRAGKSQWASYGYGNGLTEIDITPKMRLDSVVRKVSDLPMGGTDCSLPILYAMDKGLEIDAVIILTDSETWAGIIAPSQALVEYRKQSGRNTKLIVVGMTSTGFSIADPSDAGMLDVVGFDTAAPQIMSDFVLGKV
jgi:60 kDa SS-A/Ro ribonucleoprotein